MLCGTKHQMSTTAAAKCSNWEDYKKPFKELLTSGVWATAVMPPVSRCDLWNESKQSYCHGVSYTAVNIASSWLVSIVYWAVCNYLLHSRFFKGKKELLYYCSFKQCTLRHMQCMWLEVICFSGHKSWPFFIIMFWTWLHRGEKCNWGCPAHQCFVVNRNTICCISLTSNKEKVSWCGCLYFLCVCDNLSRLVALLNVSFMQTLQLKRWKIWNHITE